MEETNDPKLRSWIEVSPDSDFPMQNLPYGVFRRPGGLPAVGVAVGDWVVDLARLHEARIFADLPQVGNENCFARAQLNDFMALGKRAWEAARTRVSELLRSNNSTLRNNEALRRKAMVRRADVEMMLPAACGDYIDFYSSRHHASNVGIMFRGPASALQPNWVHLPVAYHGCTSSLGVSGRDVRRPNGQLPPAAAGGLPGFGPTCELDFELEVGFFVGTGNDDGRPISTAEAADAIFGFVLVNDWSARDIQRWEYQPLGPFLGKSFATSISPWVVPLAALEPFRVPGPVQDPPVLPYLRYRGDWAFDLNLEAWLTPQGTGDAVRICRSNLRLLYWNALQQLAHATVNGARRRPGDLLASGTVSGPTRDSMGCMLEITRNGADPLELPGGIRRAFLQDGDSITLRGWCQGPGYRVGFGECTARVLPAA